MKSLAICGLGVLALAACEPVIETRTPEQVTDAAVASRLAGRALVNETEALVQYGDGTLIATNSQGRWFIENGKWCQEVVNSRGRNISTCREFVQRDRSFSFINMDGLYGETFAIRRIGR